MSRRAEYLSPAEVAEVLGVSVNTIKRRIYDGDLPAYRLGRQLRVKRADLDALLVPVQSARSVGR